MNKSLIISLHDVHPGSHNLVREQRQILSDAGVSACSILIVPEFHHGTKVEDRPEFIQWASNCESAGDELVLHGYYHDRQGHHESIAKLFWTKIYSKDEAEFFDLDQVQADARLLRGRRLFKTCGWNLRGFIAPAWLMPSHLPSTLTAEGFLYTNNLMGVMQLRPTYRWVPARSLCWSVRSAWRRTASIAWNAYSFKSSAGAPLLRMSLHPKDFSFVTIRKQIIKVVKRALEDGYKPITYASYATS